MSRLKSKLVKKILTAAAITVTACSDASLPAAPEMPAQTAVAPGQLVAAAMRATPLAGTVTETKVIGPAGGEISLAGVTLSVPKGALDRPVAITATVPAGSSLQVEFAPHGLQFNAPFTLTFDGVQSSDVVGVYFEGDAGAFVRALQSFPTTTSGSSASFNSDHFSGYIVVQG